MIYVTAIPREDMNSVSTRVHYHYYLNNLPAHFRWERHSGSFGDVLYVQKKADDATIKVAKKAKDLGIPIVYDCDDNPYERSGKRRATMVRMAAAVTTDTEGRKRQIEKATRATNIVVIPECVDYCDRLQELKVRDTLSTVITFGNNANAVHAAKYMKHFGPGVACRHINSKKMPKAGKFVKWRLKTFVPEMMKADVCLLAHGDDLKSDLKLLVCVALGVPAIVSDTRYYRQLMERLDLEWLVAKSHKSASEILEKLRPKEVREGVVRKYKESRILEERSPSRCGQMLGKVFESVCSRSV